MCHGVTEQMQALSEIVVRERTEDSISLCTNLSIAKTIQSGCDEDGGGDTRSVT